MKKCWMKDLLVHEFHDKMQTKFQGLYDLLLRHHLCLLSSIAFTWYRLLCSTSCCVGSHTVERLLCLTGFPCGWNVENHYCICAEWFYCTQADVVFIMLRSIDIYSVFGYTWRVQVSELQRKTQIVSAGDWVLWRYSATYLQYMDYVA